ncbi:hypothetical protein HZU73_09714 [Apis mellifera caucasica]|nr:hypothetical protein HZU73_09714 [Apis mellifera caucasica]KAG9428684.1 hypothetical protein HZU67_10088 [Apis mellifera carnica]
MSGSDGEDGQCNRTRESNVVAMDDVLVKKHTDDILHDGCISSEDDFTRQESDWAVNYMEDAVRSPVVADSVPVASVALDESVVDEFVKGARGPDNMELNTMQMRPKTVIENSNTTVSLESPFRGKEMCSCNVCKAKRELLGEELQKAIKFQNLWTELRQHIRGSFNIALEASRIPGGLQFHQTPFSADDTHKIVLQLCKRNPHQLFMRLVSLAQEFVIEVKVHLLALLHDLSVNNLAEVFLTGSEYQRLVHRYLWFDKEMTVIRDLWAETESWMDKYNEFQETDGQLLTLTSQAKVDVSEMDNRSLSPTPDLSLDSPDMPPSIEILQILLDDWSKVVKSLRQKLSDVAGAQPVTDIYTNGQEDFFDYACATCHLVQSAMRSVKYCYYVHEL